jgi:haloalkane dehalogenase
MPVPSSRRPGRGRSVPSRWIPVLLGFSVAGCETGAAGAAAADDQEIAFLRTPDERFAGLPDYPFPPRYAQVRANLRMHYLDEGARDGQPVVLLHGEPSWSYLYREMIPVLVEAGFRVIAPDLVGFGRSDKPVRREDHTYARHVEWLRELLFDRLDLAGVSLFAQDWGGLIGLRLVAENADRFARVAVANTGLPTGDRSPGDAFLRWLEASQRMPVFSAGAIIQSATTTELSAAEVAAYDAPFPDSTYQAGARVMPTLVPITPDDPASAANRAAWDRLREWQRPFITFFSDQDPITRGWETEFQEGVPGAARQPHTVITGAGHFLQEDKGEELARLLVEFVRATAGTEEHSSSGDVSIVASAPHRAPG